MIESAPTAGLISLVASRHYRQQMAGATERTPRLTGYDPWAAVLSLLGNAVQITGALAADSWPPDKGPGSDMSTSDSAGINGRLEQGSDAEMIAQFGAVSPVVWRWYWRILFCMSNGLSYGAATRIAGPRPVE
jgi:hypothetical protein